MKWHVRLEAFGDRTTVLTTIEVAYAEVGRDGSLQFFDDDTILLKAWRAGSWLFVRRDSAADHEGCDHAA
jgi:hypothetical protein